MHSLDRMLGFICDAYSRACQMILSLMVLGVLSEVAMRYFLARGILGSGEITRLAITWIVFLMAAVLYRRRRHIVVSALIDVMSGRMRHLCAVIINVAVIVLSGYVLYQLYVVWDFLGLTTPVFGIPDTLFKIAPVFGFVPMALQSLTNLVLDRPTVGGVQDI